MTGTGTVARRAPGADVADVGHRLLTERGMQWLFGHGGDPHALLLRDEAADPDEHAGYLARIRERGPLYRARDGYRVSATPAVVRGVLGGTSVLPHGPDGAVADLLPDVAELLAPAARYAPPDPGPDPGPGAAAPEPDGDLVRAVRAAAVDAVAAGYRLGPADRDVLAGAAADAGAVLDALACPPRLPAARAMSAAVARVRDALGPDRWAAAVAGVELVTGTTVNTVLALLDEPGALAAAADPERAAAAVDRTLRRDPPLRLHRLVATADLEVAGQTVAAGDRLALYTTGDPAGPDGTGAGSPPTALAGDGLAAAVGPFVRARAVAQVRELAARAPSLRRAGPAVRRLRAPVTRAVVRCPVTTGPISGGEPRCGS